MVGRLAALQIRPATSSDLPALRRLYGMVDREHAEFEPSLKRGRSPTERDRRLLAALGEVTTRVTVVAQGVDVLAFALASFHRDRPDVVIEAIVVEPSARRRGHGRALIDDVQHWMVGRRGRFLELAVYDFNADALGFYESLGFISFSRSLRRSRPIG